MNFLRKLSNKFILIFLLALLLVITAWTMLTINSNATVLRENELMRRLLAISLSLLFVLAFFDASNRIDDFDQMRRRRFEALCWLCILAFQAFVFVVFSPNQITDSFMVSDQSLSLALGIDKEFDQSKWYYSIYKNNNLLTILISWLYKGIVAAGLLNCSGKIFCLINICCVDLSIVFLCLAAKAESGEALATKTLFLSMLNPMNYVLIHWFYSLVLSLPLMTTPVYLALRHDKRRTSWVWISLIAVFGYYLRPTVLIPIIAVILVSVAKERKAVRVKEMLINFALAVVPGTLLFVMLKALTDSYITDSSRYLPMIHWYMMGMHSQGEAIADDIAYIGSLPSSKIMFDEALGNIRWTRTLYTPKTFAIHQLRKLAYTWSDGSCNYRLGLYTDHNLSRAYQWICGEKEDFLLLYCQVYRIAVYCLSLISIIKQLKEPRTNGRFLAALALFGGICFYMLWEAKPIYCVPFLPFAVFLASDGCSLLSCDEKKRPAVSLGLCGLSIVATLLAGIVYYKPFVETGRLFNEYALFTEGYGFELYSDAAGGEIKQTFTVRKPFNEVLIECRVTDENGVSLISVCDDAGGILTSGKITASKISGDYYIVQMDATLPGGNFSIAVEDESPGIEYVYMRAKTLSQYEGDATRNGEPIPDLNIRVRETCFGTYMTAAPYVLLFACLILIEAAFCVKKKI